MAGLLNRLAPKGYPGQIFVCMLRYGYGNQQHVEKMEILHAWYSHLRAFLPVKFEKKSDQYREIVCGEDEKGNKVDLLKQAHDSLGALFQTYDPMFEDSKTMSAKEKDFIQALWLVYDTLDEITARSKIIDGLQTDEGEEMVAG